MFCLVLVFLGKPACPLIFDCKAKQSQLYKLCVCAYVCVCMRACVCMCVCVCVRACACMCVHACVCVSVCVHTYVLPCMYLARLERVNVLAVFSSTILLVLFGTNLIKHRSATH